MEKKPEKLTLNRTQRGFLHGKFTDRYGQQCSIQKSSLMADEGEECIWLGVKNSEGNFKVLRHGMHLGWEKKKLVEMFPDSDLDIPDRMHLTQKMVKQLLPILEYFAETGELPDSIDDYALYLQEKFKRLGIEMSAGAAGLLAEKMNV